MKYLIRIFLFHVFMPQNAAEVAEVHIPLHTLVIVVYIHLYLL